MRCLFFHVKEYWIEITGLADRPPHIRPEPIQERSQAIKNGIVAFITVENGDDATSTKPCIKDILRFAEEVNEARVVIAPFAHLSSDLASSADALPLLKAIEQGIRNANMEVIRSHFGSDKEMLVHLFGHRGNVRFRQY